MALDQTQKDKIAEALGKLDHKNDAHWADDGLPRTAVVQQLANDPNIRRTDINETAPGFARVVAGASNVTEFPQPKIDDNGDLLVETASAPTEPAPTSEDPNDPYVETRDILRKRVVEAEYALNGARKAEQEAITARVNCERALQRAREYEAARFPRISPDQLIQEHLKSEHQKRIAAARQRQAAANGTNPADFSFTGGRRMGSTKPYAKNDAGELVRPLSRLDIARQRGLPNHAAPINAGPR